jgi:hypothetical protein
VRCPYVLAYLLSVYLRVSAAIVSGGIERHPPTRRP